MAAFVAALVYAEKNSLEAFFRDILHCHYDDYFIFSVLPPPFRIILKLAVSKTRDSRVCYIEQSSFSDFYEIMKRARLKSRVKFDAGVFGGSTARASPARKTHRSRGHLGSFITSAFS